MSPSNAQSETAAPAKRQARLSLPCSVMGQSVLLTSYGSLRSARKDDRGTLPNSTGAHRRAGFTLVEVIVVLVILALLAAIAIPALTGYIDKAQDKKYIALFFRKCSTSMSFVHENASIKRSRSSGLPCFIRF
jgi:prepilin-type N-terminal cleavage/methylation domain-containing protein